MRQKVSSGSPYEPIIGFSRAVRAGNTVYVSGTASIKDGQVYGEGDAYVQAKQCLEIIADALAQAGSSLQDVVRTRLYIADMSRWEDIARAHREAFADVRPATTLVEAKLASPEMLVEIEAIAVIGE